MDIRLFIQVTNGHIVQKAGMNTSDLRVSALVPNVAGAGTGTGICTVPVCLKTVYENFVFDVCLEFVGYSTVTLI